MRLLFLFALVLVGETGLWAGPDYFYAAAVDGIYRGSIDSDTGRLGELTLAGAGKHPNFLALSPDGKSLYATLDQSVAAYAVGTAGELARLNEMPVGGAEPCHVTVDPSGRDVLVADYGGGCIACFRREADGSIGERTALESFAGSGPDPKRQTQPYAHSVCVDPSDKFVYACDLGTDHVWIFKFDAASGALTSNDPPFASVAPGSGPRHLALGGEGRCAYVASEMGHSVTVFARDAATGQLRLVQSLSTLAAGTTPKGVTTAEIAVHPSGRWLYVSNRGCDSIEEFAIAPDGRLRLAGCVASVAKFPRSFAIDPTGRWLVVAGQGDNRLAVLEVDAETGRLTSTGEAAAVTAPMCVVFDEK